VKSRNVALASDCRPPGALSRSELQKQVTELQEQVTELAAQRAAISAVLRAVASSPHDLQPILQTIFDSAVHLCRAEVGTFRLVEEAGLRLVAYKARPAFLELYSMPTLLARSSFVAHFTKSPVHIPDLAAHEVYRAGGAYPVALVKAGLRPALYVPMLRNDELIGALSMARGSIGPFTEKEIELVIDFAAQAAIALQITRRERQYREVQTELAHANRVAVIGQLTASIAHELKQPLGAVKVNGDAGLRWLATQPPDLGEVKLALERAVESACRGSDIITGLMDLTKKQPRRKEPVDINGVIQEVSVLTHGEARKYGVSLSTKLAPQLAYVEGDRVQLQQVVLNLAINAVQAMSAADEGPRELLISTEGMEDQGVRVRVQDTGPGLSPESLPRLFDPFYTTKAGGVGMGLAICQSIVAAHDGRLWATSCEPRGALFQFEIPARQGAVS
jgi:C4-dicarboxylate-specific signal transduction histidine kinase